MAELEVPTTKSNPEEYFHRKFVRRGSGCYILWRFFTLFTLTCSTPCVVEWSACEAAGVGREVVFCCSLSFNSFNTNIIDNVNIILPTTSVKLEVNLHSNIKYIIFCRDICSIGFFSGKKWHDLLDFRPNVTEG